MKYYCLLLFCCLFSCERLTLKNNPTYKSSQKQGIATDSTFLFLLPEQTGKAEFSDIHCFDKYGQALNAGNCANGIAGIVEALYGDSTLDRKQSDALYKYVHENKFMFLTGKPLTFKALPHRDYYVFYSFLYIIADHVNANGQRDTTILHAIRKAQQLAAQHNVGFYLVTPSTEK
jgi:hypothetical protein